jgi:uncharacterized SAM-dependent methyltransferase
MKTKEFIRLEDYFELYTKITSCLDTKGSDIPNKYLYLGWHGAKKWHEINTHLYEKHINHTIFLLEELFDRIHKDIVTNILGESKEYDIVSLGSGLAREDAKMFSMMSQLNIRFNHIKFSAIDISYELLVYGMNEICKQKAWNFNKLNAIWLDFEKLHLAKSFINGNKPRLFHLLGLTLGNNNEISILGEIYKVMDESDFLLIDIDCSNESAEELVSIKELYEKDKTITDPWLCNSLFFKTEIRALINKSTNSFRYRPSYQLMNKDRVASVQIIYHEIEENVIKTKVPGGASLARSHVYFNNNGVQISSAICDYSNKYAVEGFNDFIEKTLYQKNIRIYFSIVKLYSHPNTNTKLVLLKKKQENISNSGLNQADISRLKNIIESYVHDKESVNAEVQIKGQKILDILMSAPEVLKYTDEFTKLVIALNTGERSIPKFENCIHAFKLAD